MAVRCSGSRSRRGEQPWLVTGAASVRPAWHALRTDVVEALRGL
ncbi:MAG: hypothetical protein ACT4QD_14090 [Acidobacteriota bacterium]